MEVVNSEWAMELRRVKDENGRAFYIFTGDSEGFAVDISELDAKLHEVFGISGEIAHTIGNMAVEGYIVRYYPQENKVVAEVSFTEEG